MGIEYLEPPEWDIPDDAKSSLEGIAAAVIKRTPNAEGPVHETSFYLPGNRKVDVMYSRLTGKNVVWAIEAEPFGNLRSNVFVEVILLDGKYSLHYLRKGHEWQELSPNQQRVKKSASAIICKVYRAFTENS